MLSLKLLEAAQFLEIYHAAFGYIINLDPGLRSGSHRVQPAEQYHAHTVRPYSDLANGSLILPRT